MTATPIQIPPALVKVRNDLAAALSLDSGTSGFDVDTWLQGWLLIPQAALGGDRPLDLLKSQKGTERVAQLLGSMLSGAYQ